MTYLDRAIKDGYAIITGPENMLMSNVFLKPSAHSDRGKKTLEI